MKGSSKESSLKTRNTPHLTQEAGTGTSVFTGLAASARPRPKTAAPADVQPLDRRSGRRRKVETKTKRGAPRPLNSVEAQAAGSRPTITHTMSLVGLPATPKRPGAVAAAMSHPKTSTYQELKAVGVESVATQVPQNRRPIGRSPLSAKAAGAEMAKTTATQPEERQNRRPQLVSTTSQILDCVLDSPHHISNPTLIGADRPLSLVASITSAVCVVGVLFYVLAV